MDNARILIMAGGTGGHVFPALTVAKQLELEGWEVLWLGTRLGLETEIVREAGIPIRYISVTGLRGKKALTLFLAPYRLCLAFCQSLNVILRFKPKVVLGMGGFVSGPGGLAAWVLRVPLIIHEQNAVPGTTNRILAHLARRVLHAFPNTFAHSNKKLLTGNPVRQALLTLPLPETRFQGRSGPLRVLVIGGSRGAAALNELCPKALALMPSSVRPEVRHQSGALNVEETEAAYQEVGIVAEVLPFIQDMAEAYAWADLVICRAGALTISELGAVGVGSILVPFPFAIDDHQYYNAHFLEKAGAAILVRQHELKPQVLADYLMRFAGDREEGLKLAIAAKQAFHLNATSLVAKACQEVAYAE
jgi:UDP-N-acetylglucosamine--N-acetylmuramyl-(pentapeptide) pyrophosphoryl-undecaprenol N-acetylglucosamine transferase